MTIPAPDVLACEQTLRILILCEDDSAWRRASITQAHLQRELHNGLLLHFSSWRFRWLYHPKILQMAVAEAQAADLVLVFHAAAHRSTTGVRQCIRAWLNVRRPKRLRLLAVHATPVGGQERERWSLRPTCVSGNEEADFDAPVRLVCGKPE